jgi:hypothetical protein
LEIEVFFLAAARAEGLGEEDLGIIVTHQFVSFAVNAVPIRLLRSRDRRKPLQLV